MKKAKNNCRFVASGLFSVLLIAELFMFAKVMNSYTITTWPVSCLLLAVLLPILAVDAIIVMTPVFDNPTVKEFVLYGGVLYACANIVMYYGAAMVYAYAWNIDSQYGIYIVAGTVAVYLIALLLASVGTAPAEGEAEVEEAPDAELKSDEKAVTVSADGTSVEFSAGNKAEEAADAAEGAAEEKAEEVKEAAEEKADDLKAGTEAAAEEVRTEAEDAVREKTDL